MRRFKNAPRWLAMAGWGLLMAACGGGGSGAGGSGAGENQAPTVFVQFPLSGSLTTGTGITVRGTATDPDGDAITEVTVHGVLAETDDGFATWQAPNVPLQAGTQSLEGVVRDAEGGVGRFSLTVARGENPGPALRSPKGLALDDTGSEPRLLVTDQALDALFALDLSEGPTLGHRTILSRRGDGNGIDFVVPSDVVVDAAANRALVLDRRNFSEDGKVIAVDLATQARTELFSGFDFALSLALDATNNRLLIGDSGPDRLMKLDLDNPAAGTTNIVSAGFPSSIDLDPDNPDRALMVDAVVGVRALFEVDLANKTKRRVASIGDPGTVAFDPASAGERAVLNDGKSISSINIASGAKTLLSGPDGEGTIIGTGTRLSARINDTLFDASDDNRLWVSEGSNDVVFVVDMASGDRIVLGSRLGSGPDLVQPAGVVLVPDAATGQPMAVVLDDSRSILSNEIYLVNLSPGDVFGDRAILSGFDANNPNERRGQGPALGEGFSAFRDLVADTAKNRLLVADATLRAVVAVDLESGDRTILSGDDQSGGDIGEGPFLSLSNVTAMALDAINNRVLVVASDAVLAVDLDSGDRAFVSEGDGSEETDIGTGPEILKPIDLALDAINSRLLVLGHVNGDEEAPGYLMSVDLTSGDRTLISSPDIGNGNPVELPVAVALDADNNRALILDSAFGFDIDQRPPSIVAVDLDSGDRSVVSGQDLGPDGQFNTGDDQYLGGGSPFNPTSSPTDAAFDAEARVLYVTDERTGSLIAVDVDSGDRVLVSGFDF
ncbi:hypothetical protein LL254_13860 [Marinobacter nauticus]|uniref:hypothetical protein n=1 Tax=Marinobacter nauticus TaxID=2743 RepID=UPI001D189438|nr:hypothetical protein [Marinobacter nauticus]MCC4271800.1 hypothetical protein [Marinobacter nauticus]